MRPAFLSLSGAVVHQHDWFDLPSLAGVSTVFFDTETTGLDRFDDRPVGIAIGYGGTFRYISFAHRGGGNLFDEDTVRRWALTELRDKRMVGLNTKFDVHILESWGVPLREMGCTFHDVSHSEALLDDHEKRFGLDHLAQKRLGEGKLDVGPKAAIADLPAGAVAEYAKRDVALVARLADVYAPLLAAEDLGRVSALEDAVIPVCVEMERNGAPLDVERLTRWDERAQELIEQLQWDLYRMVGFMVNPDAPTDMARLWAKVGEPVTARTAQGRPSFTTDIVQAAAERHPAVALVWRIGKLLDLRSKYFQKYLKEHRNGVIHPQFNQLMTDEGGTVSGRFSCVRPNLQQVLAKNKHRRAYGWLSEYGEEFFVKDLFVPRDGVWVSADMKQCEYRLFTHYTQSRRLLDIYDADPMTNFHAMVKGMVTPYKPDIDDTQVKVFNFLSIFGGGVGAAARNLNIDMADAEALSQAYHRAFPEARDLLNRCMRVADDRGWVKTFLGRRSRFHGQRGHRERTHKALNAVVQGTAADANKLALVAVYEARKALGLTMRITVHDSLEVDMQDPARLPEYERLLNEQRLALRVPLLWDVKQGSSWGTAA